MAAEIKFSKDVRKIYFVRTITRHKFELESPSLHQTCIMGYSRLVLKMKVIDLDILAILTQNSRNFGLSAHQLLMDLS